MTSNPAPYNHRGSRAIHAVTLVQKGSKVTEFGAVHIFHIFEPCDSYMTFEVKLLITFVATHLLVILVKFDQDQMKHVEVKQTVRKRKETARKKYVHPPNLINIFGTP